MKIDKKKVSTVFALTLLIVSLFLVTMDGPSSARAAPVPPMYWKENCIDYAPSGMPDFDQRQDLWNTTGWWTWCAPTAAANSLWWMDSRPTTGACSTAPPPTINDTFQLVTNYTAGIDDHDPKNVVHFIQHLAWLMDTDGQRTGNWHRGTWTKDIQCGITQYLSWSGVNPLGDTNGDGIVNQVDLEYVELVFSGLLPFSICADVDMNGIINMVDVAKVKLGMMGVYPPGPIGSFYVHTLEKPNFYEVEEEVERCQDAILVLGFYNEYWERENTTYELGSGHCVTVAGINSTTLKIAISDPDNDAFEAGLTPGRSPVPHAYPHNSSIHNNASLVSHDIYNVTFVPGCPNGTWALQGYVGAPPDFPIAVVEAAVITSPRRVGVTQCLYSHALISEVYKTWTAIVTVIVPNYCSVPITCTVNAYYYNATFTQQIGTSQNVIDLPPCNNATLIFSLNCSSLPVGVTYTVKVNFTCTCGDSNEFINGPIKRRLWGDVNGDGIVFGDDVSKLDLIYSEQPPFPKPPYDKNHPETYYPFMPDITGDCIVFGDDVSMLDLIYSGQL